MLNAQTLQNGNEQYEKFNTTSGLSRKKVKMYQYDYRHSDGQLFSCVRETLKDCREYRDEWLKVRGLK